jgi:hypothetical protein
MITVVESGDQLDRSDPIALAGDDPAGSYAKARDRVLQAMTRRTSPDVRDTPQEWPADQG